jgi:DNA-binding response OmpR family regulator
MTLTSTKKNLILVCDDDLEILGMMTKTLQSNPKYDVVDLKTGNEVLEYLKSEKPLPDLLILDLWLPDIDSDEIIPLVREDAVTKDIPIILISAIVKVEIIADELGVEDYLSKPFLLEELEYKVAQLLN